MSPTSTTNGTAPAADDCADALGIVQVEAGTLVVSASAPTTLSVEAIGSGLVVLLYDPVEHVAGLLHAILPAARLDNRRAAAEPGLFVDSGIEALIAAFHATGGDGGRSLVRLVGAAEPRYVSPGHPGLSVGRRNIEAAVSRLMQFGLQVHGRHTGMGEIHGVRLAIATGATTILKSMGRQEAL